MKIATSETYNYIFNEETGFFARWGETLDDDPIMSPLGNEIADIEISTKCHGVDGKVCKFCYKSNTPNGKYMTIDEFKIVFSKLPKNMTQIAFGIGDIDSNPDMWKIFKHCRENGVVPNLTINGDRMTNQDINGLVNYCGAVAVSRYNPKDVCYDAVNTLTDAGLDQVNIHMLLSKETMDDVYELIEDAKNDGRLKKLNAIVFLSLKTKGRGQSFTPLTKKEFKEFVKIVMLSGINYGFDSCTANKFLNAVEKIDEETGSKNYNKVKDFIEPCESGIFSIYVNVDGVAFPCSFTEFGDGIDLHDVNDFLEDVWYSDYFNEWRERLLYCNRSCPVYRV